LGVFAGRGYALARFAFLRAEGSAHNLTFAKALKAWRPLLRKGGVAVVSEMSWFGSARPKAAAEFWAREYPQMRSGAENLAACAEQGFEAHADHYGYSYSLLRAV
jgi:hypothetical protein